MKTNATWFRTSGACGIITPIAALIFISLAIASCPEFSWVDNALSDLGAVHGATALLFNSGLIISGIFSFIFATGLFVFLGGNVASRAGAVIFVLATVSLLAIGMFPESVRPVHYLVSVAFFVLMPISMLVIAGAFWLLREVRMAVFTLLVAVAAAAPWILYFSIRYVSGVAVPEAVSAFAGAVWAIVLGFKMFRVASHPKPSSFSLVGCENASLSVTSKSFERLCPRKFWRSIAEKRLPRTLVFSRV